VSPYVYHSRASCIEGHFRLLPSRAAYLAAGGAEAGVDMPAHFCLRAWDPATGAAVQCG